MFDTLLELATNDQQNTDEEIRALASACLLSLSVAYGDTGRLKQGLLRVWSPNVGRWPRTSNFNAMTKE